MSDAAIDERPKIPFFILIGFAALHYMMGKFGAIADDTGLIIANVYVGIAIAYAGLWNLVGRPIEEPQVQYEQPVAGAYAAPPAAGFDALESLDLQDEPIVRIKDAALPDEPDPNPETHLTSDEEARLRDSLDDKLD